MNKGTNINLLLFRNSDKNFTYFGYFSYIFNKIPNKIFQKRYKKYFNKVSKMYKYEKCNTKNVRKVATMQKSTTR